MEKLWAHLSAYEEYLSKLWNSLWTTVNHYNNASKKFNQIEKDIFKITDIDVDKNNVLLIDKPE